MSVSLLFVYLFICLFVYLLCKYTNLRNRAGQSTSQDDDSCEENCEKSWNEDSGAVPWVHPVAVVRVTPREGAVMIRKKNIWKIKIELN